MYDPALGLYEVVEPSGTQNETEAESSGSTESAEVQRTQTPEGTSQQLSGDDAGAAEPTAEEAQNEFEGNDEDTTDDERIIRAIEAAERGDEEFEGQPFSKEDREELLAEHRAAVEELNDYVEAYFDSNGHADDEEPEEPVENMAGEGRTGWARIGYDEASEKELWEYDLTGGRVPDNHKNALLCREAKKMMVAMCAAGWEVEAIADWFRVRHQRVLAILALEHLEAERMAAGEQLFDDFADVMEGGPGTDGTGQDGNLGYFDCDEIMGSGERHIKMLPRAPHYEEKMLQQNPEATYEAMEELMAAEEDEAMIKDFEEKLFYNLGLAGSSIKRDVTKAHRPKRPKEGYSLVVKPLGKAKDKEKIYVASPSGARRELNEDESFMQYRRTPRPRRKLYDPISV